MASQSLYEEDNVMENVVVLMVPFPMQGHLNQILHLSCLITSYNIPLHFAGSTTHNHQAKLRIHGWNPKKLTQIKFHDFNLPPYTSLSPNPNSKFNFPSHLQPLFHACTHLRAPMSLLLQDLATKFRRVVVIHDTLVASMVQDVKHIPNAESYSLHSVSAFTVFYYVWDSMNPKPFDLDHKLIPPQLIPSSEGCFTPEFTKFMAQEYKVLDFESGRLFNTCRLLEETYMELLEKLPMNANKKFFAVGPFNPTQVMNKKQHRCLEWLDKQERHSVLFISFGTSTSLSQDQIMELASGLERSGQKFIWVLRNADKDDVFTEDEGGSGSPELPKGYEERVKNRGIVVKEWAPQLEILGHPSTGGFMSHCGWNSCIESISMGVPILGWPMHSDQPRNAVLITRVLKIGIEVRNWEQRDELVMAETVENVVLKLMVSKDGEKIRSMAQEMGSVVRGAVVEGGVSSLEMDSFIAHITR